MMGDVQYDARDENGERKGSREQDASRDLLCYPAVASIFASLSLTRCVAFGGCIVSPAELGLWMGLFIEAKRMCLPLH